MKSGGILQASIKDRGIVLDPRTKLLLLITMSAFVLGGFGSDTLSFLAPSLCVVPFVLLLSAKKYAAGLAYAGLYGGTYLANLLLAPHLGGFLYFIVLAITGILTKFMPGVTLGLYVVSTTTVSEFTAAMLRMRISEKLIIPLSVIFRLFPTIADEFSSINAAMRMRGVSLGGKRWTKMLEYRLIPLMACSVQIGNELSAAALTRGLGGDVRRTNVCKIGFHRQDMAVIALCVAPFAFMILSLCGVT